MLRYVSTDSKIDTKLMFQNCTIHTDSYKFYCPTYIDFLHSQQWNSISGKGCFFLDVPDRSDPVISCHHFALTLPERSSVWMESLPGMCVIGDHNGAQKLVIIIINFYKWLNKGLSTFSVVVLCLVL